MTILLLFCLILVILLTHKIYENFTDNIVGYNSISVPANPVPTVYETETKTLSNILRQLLPDSDLDYTKNGYILHNDYIPFPLNNPIKKMLSDYIKKNVSLFKEDKIEINTDLHNIYWKDDGIDRLFIFNVNLLNNTHFVTRNIRVKILVKNIKQFLQNSEKTNYRTDIPSATLINSTKIMSIRLDMDMFSLFSIKGTDMLRPNYYEIKNYLYLMDPFVTSGRDMIINDKMKKDFIPVLEAHEKLLKELSK